jgi:hypothetical protein
LEFFQLRHRDPAKPREQPDGALLDKLVFGVGVGHGLNQIHLPLVRNRKHAYNHPWIGGDEMKLLRCAEKEM